MTKTQLFDNILAIQHETDITHIDAIIKAASARSLVLDPTDRVSAVTKYKGLDDKDCFIIDAVIFALNAKGIPIKKPTDFSEIKPLLVSFKRICDKIIKGNSVTLKEVYKFLISLSIDDSFKYAESNNSGVSTRIDWHIRRLSGITSLVNRHYPGYLDSGLLHVAIQGEL